MKKEIRNIDEKLRIMQVTTVDERWYARETEDKETGLPSYQYVPSATWVAGHYPKGTEFYKWLASKGWDESQALKQAAGDKGSKVHQGVDALLNGQELTMESRLMNPSTREAEELTLEEYECLMAFVDWYREAKPTRILLQEAVVWNDEYGYAGTLDLLAEIGGEVWLIDFKTGQYVWPEYELQVSAYKHALPDHDKIKLGILQLGYRRNKRGWKLTEVEDRFNLFLAAREIWKHATAGQKPMQRDYPLALKIDYTQHSNDNNNEQGRTGETEQPDELPAAAAPRAERAVAQRRKRKVS